MQQIETKSLAVNILSVSMLRLLCACAQVVRGTTTLRTRAADRNGIDPAKRYENNGFRLARTLP